MRVWDIYPAIDLRYGEVVRLKQGDPNRAKTYETDPLRAAQRWKDAGARWIHVVNLDGALDESGQANEKALERIVTVGVPIQFGGGIRDMPTLQQALDLGVSRVVIGTAAVETPQLVTGGLAQFGPERIAVGIDAHRGKVRTHGWASSTEFSAVDFARHWADQGLRWTIFTDVARDGMGSGLNIESTAQLARQSGLNVIASGGVDSLRDVQAAYDAGLSGCIIGRALYEGRVDLEQALGVGKGGDHVG